MTSPDPDVGQLLVDLWRSVGSIEAHRDVADSVLAELEPVAGSDQVYTLNAEDAFRANQRVVIVTSAFDELETFLDATGVKACDPAELRATR